MDIGYEKNAFLHFWDALPGLDETKVEKIDRGPGKDGQSRNGNKAKKPTAKDIPTLYPVGSEVLVQVTKGPIGTKGPRVTTNLSLAGRYLVFMPYSDQSGISRKIEDPKERDRLRKILRGLDIPDGMGVIIRTAGEGQRARFFVRDLSILLEQWAGIEEGTNTKRAPACLFEEPDLIDRTVRDFLTDEVDKVVCDDQAAVEHMKEAVGQISSRSKNRVEHHSDHIPLFEKYGVQRQIDDAFHRQVWLKCGGYIVFDETEALIAIDVNTGRNKGSKDMDKTILQTNMEAADEIARQLRLRNVGGLIIGDFIDMKAHKDRQAVYDRMKERLKARQVENTRLTHFRIRLDGNDPPARAGKPQRLGLHAVSVLPGPRQGQEQHEHERGTPARAQLHHAQAPGNGARTQGDGASRSAPAVAHGGRGTARRDGTPL